VKDFTVRARAAELETAVARAYEACGKIRFDGAHYRKDIAARALKEGIDTDQQ